MRRYRAHYDVIVMIMILVNHRNLSYGLSVPIFVSESAD